MATYTFPDPNGGSMTVNAPDPGSAETAARAQGWNPGMGTYGSNTGPGFGDTGGGNGGGGSGGGGGGGGGNFGGLGAFSAGASGVTQAQLDEQKREFDAQLAWAQQMWQQQGLPQLEISQRAQALQEQEYQYQTQLAQQNMALQQAGVLGYYVPPSQMGLTPPAPVSTSGFPGTQASTPLARYGSGTVVRDADTGAFGVVGPGGSLQVGDAGNPAIYAALQNPGSISTVTNADFNAGAQYQSPPQFGAGPGTTGTAQGVGGAFAPGGAAGANATGPGGGTMFNGANPPMRGGGGTGGMADGGTTGSFPGMPAGAIPTLAALQQMYQQGVTTAGLTGLYQGSPTLAAQQQQFEQALQEQQFRQQQQEFAKQFGLSQAQAAAQLGGPENVFQQSQFYRGQQGDQNMPAFLQALAGGNAASQLPAFQATGTAPNPLTLGTIYGGFQGGGNQPPPPGWTGGGNTEAGMGSNAMIRTPGGGERSVGGVVGQGGGSGPVFNPGPVGAGALQATGTGWAGDNMLNANPNAPIPAPNSVGTGQGILPFNRVNTGGGGFTPSGWGGSSGWGGGSMMNPTGGGNPAMATAGGGQFNQGGMLGTIGQINQRGAQGLAPGTLERLSPDELSAFGSGLRMVGGSLPSFLQQYAQSRPQQSAMMNPMSLAA